MKKSKSKKTNTKKKNILPISILVGSIVIGVFLICLAFINDSNSEYKKLNVRDEAAVKADVDAKSKEVTKLRQEREDEYKTSALSDRYAELSNELTKSESELSDLESELYSVQSGAFDTAKEDSNKAFVLPFVGGIIVIFCGVIFYVKSKKSKAKILTQVEE